MPARPLTKLQQDAMDALDAHAGKTVDVLTSYYETGVDPKILQRAVARILPATLRGLEARGCIKIKATFWRAARITVLKARK